MEAEVGMEPAFTALQAVYVSCITFTSEYFPHIFILLRFIHRSFRNQLTYTDR